ncbi:hypothetical protein IHE44_0003053, partial [Lamprotornis superbus]
MEYRVLQAGWAGSPSPALTADSTVFHNAAQVLNTSLPLVAFEAGSTRGGLGAHELPLHLHHLKVQGLAELHMETRAGTSWEVKIRLVVEEGLNQLPYTECTVTTPTGEAMEQGLRDCCRSIRIGKILIQSDEETQRAKVYYAKFPPDIYRRKVLLMYPILSTGNTVIEAVKVLVEHGVQPSVIILLSLFSTPHGAKSIIQEFPEITILTTEVHPVAPTHFGQKDETSPEPGKTKAVRGLWSTEVETCGLESTLLQVTWCLLPGHNQLPGDLGEDLALHLRPLLVLIALLVS